MTKHIDILLTSPPSIDFPQFVEVQSESGEKLDIGEWLQPDETSPFWRFRLNAAEVLMALIADIDAVAGVRVAGQQISRTPVSTVNLKVPMTMKSDPQAARQALKEKLEARKQAAANKPTAMFDAPAKCPACEKVYNAAVHELQACVACGEDKCTAICIPAPGEPCLDCQALSAEPEEGGFDPSLVPDESPIKNPKLAAELAAELASDDGAFSGRLFDGKYHPRVQPHDNAEPPYEQEDNDDE